MITVLKLAGLSAALSAGVVTAFEAPTVPVAKMYTDRIAPDAAPPIRLTDATGVATSRVVMNDAAAPTDCRAQTWPYVARDCIAADGARKVVRTITIERRDQPNTSILVRLPVAGQ